MARQLLFTEFNAAFYNRNFYNESRKRNKFLIPWEKNLFLPDPILNEILTLCTSTESVKTYGLTVDDFMDMDFFTYDQVKEFILADTNKRQTILTKTHNELQQKTNNLRRQ